MMGWYRLSLGLGSIAREYRDSTFYVNSIHLKAGKPLFYWNVIISERLKVEAFGFSGSFLALALP